MQWKLILSHLGRPFQRQANRTKLGGRVWSSTLAGRKRVSEIMYQILWTYQRLEYFLPHVCHVQIAWTQARAFLPMTMTTSYTSLATISAATNGINDLAFSSDGTLLASASDDKYLRVFVIQRKISMVWHFRGEAEFTAVAWIGKDLFAGTMNGELLLFPRVVVSCT